MSLQPKRRILADALGLALDLDYVDADRRRSRRAITALRVEDYETEGGVYRVSVRAREGGHRMVRLLDLLRAGPAPDARPADADDALATAGT